GHTAHATEQEAREETLQMWEVYREFSENVAAIPMLAGEKTPGERFAGAVSTYTIEGMMRDGKALQCGTSHYLGTNFAEAFDMRFQDENNEQQLCHTTSWGMSTRMIGAIILGHGDDAGLVVPPRLAPVQVVILPIGRGEDGDRTAAAARDLAHRLEAAGARVEVDDRDQSPGFRINDAELRGIPFRVELGPRDLEAGQVLVAPRVGEVDEKGRVVKAAMTPDELVDSIGARLDAYHDQLLSRARAFREERTTVVDDFDAFTTRVADGFAVAFHCGEPTCEDEIKADTAATPRAIPADGSDESGACVRCGNPSAYGKRVVFGKAY
ncbi:MAG: His/Gly/Thr/Pro-type tRNA ligase C-terminal domain-containing protein, partial [Nitriliruptorales bacterium]|nr:His/Gly/Thr/Pro-type tRNA ligase C-terminal domain-containing protein [Nitriliruptorales bacterium]